MSDAYINHGLPAGYECAGCLYDFSGAVSRTCPECGRAADVEDVRAFHARAHARDQTIGMLLMQALVGSVLCVGFAIGAGVLAGIGTGGEALVVCGLAVCGSIFAGVLASLAARRGERAAYFMLWMRTHAWLNASWLCAPVSGLVVVVAMLERARGGLPFQSPWTMATAVVGLIVWLAATVVCAAIWIVKFRVGVHAVRLRGRRAGLAFTAAAIVVLLGSMGLGFMAGVLSVIAAEKLIRPGP